MSLRPVLQAVRESFPRVQACLSELRSLPRDGALPAGPRGAARAAQDALQQFKQHSRHSAHGALEVRGPGPGRAGSRAAARQHLGAGAVRSPGPREGQSLRKQALQNPTWRCPGHQNHREHMWPKPTVTRNRNRTAETSAGEEGEGSRNSEAGSTPAAFTEAPRTGWHITAGAPQRPRPAPQERPRSLGAPRSNNRLPGGLSRGCSERKQSLTRNRGGLRPGASPHTVPAQGKEGPPTAPRHPRRSGRVWPGPRGAGPAGLWLAEAPVCQPVSRPPPPPPPRRAVPRGDRARDRRWHRR